MFLLAGCQPRAASTSPSGTTPGARVTVLGRREYAVHQQITLVNNGPGQPEKQNIWVALIQTFSPYQQVQSMQVSPAAYTVIMDEYGNHYAEFDFSGQPAGTTKTVQIDYRVTVNELAYNLSACSGTLPDDFIQPEMHIESANPQIVALAEKLSQGKGTACQQVRAFYDYIGNNLVYTYNGANWGAQAALGPMGADCTEYSDLLVALSRARRIPARYFDGLLYLDKDTTLGRMGCIGPDPGTVAGQTRYVFCPLFTRPYYRNHGGKPVGLAGRQLLDTSLLAGQQHQNTGKRGLEDRTRQKVVTSSLYKPQDCEVVTTAKLLNKNNLPSFSVSVLLRQKRNEREMVL